MLSRKHFRAIADILATAPLDPAARADLARRFASLCRSENPHFDTARFLDACHDHRAAATATAATATPTGA